MVGQAGHIRPRRGQAERGAGRERALPRAVPGDNSPRFGGHERKHLSGLFNAVFTGVHRNVVVASIAPHLMGKVAAVLGAIMVDLFDFCPSGILPQSLPVHHVPHLVG